MINWKKVLVRSAAAAGLIFGGRYAYKLYRLAKELVIDKKGMIYKVSFSDMTIRVIVTIRNPTKSTAHLSNPMVHVSYKGKTLASSKDATEEFKIPKNGSKEMPPIDIKIDFMSALLSAPELVKEYRETGSVTLTTSTSIDIDNWYNYKDVQDIPIGSGSQTLSGIARNLMASVKYNR